jgi:hypothetical protein
MKHIHGPLFAMRKASFPEELFGAPVLADAPALADGENAPRANRQGEATPVPKIIPGILPPGRPGTATPARL